MAKKKAKNSRKAKKVIRHKTVKRSVHKKIVKRKIPKLIHEKETAYPVMNRDGNLMAGVLHEPAKKSRTLIILLHGWIGYKDQTVIKQTAIDLARAGYAAYRVDLSGNGDSEGRFEDATPSKAQRDIEVILEHFRTRYGKLVLLGFSLGGMYAIIAAARTPVAGVITVAAPTHPERYDDILTPQQFRQLQDVGFTIIKSKRSVGEVPFTITEQFVREVKQAKPLDAAVLLTCPVLVIHGTADRTVPQSESEELMKMLQKKDLLLIGGADHDFLRPGNLDSLTHGIAEWLCKQKL